MELNENAEALLSSTAAVDFNAVAETTLYTCPVGKSCIITKVVVRLPSIALDTVSISFGWNTTNADDVIANAVCALSGATNYKIISAKIDAVRGVASGTFKVDVQTAEGDAATVTIDVFGYLY